MLPHRVSPDGQLLGGAAAPTLPPALPLALPSLPLAGVGVWPVGVRVGVGVRAGLGVPVAVGLAAPGSASAARGSRLATTTAPRPAPIRRSACRRDSPPARSRANSSSQRSNTPPKRGAFCTPVPATRCARRCD
jgi:hypothetical protein